MSAVLFLSHAAADKDIAAEFTRLLATGLEITGSQVFCSSLPGRTIPGGFNFVEHIRENLKSSKVVILLLTENYFASQFCLAEAGAAWISKDVVVPVVVSPFTRSRLTATLSIKQAWKIDHDDDLNSLADDIRKALEIATNHAQWGAEKKSFLMKIAELIKRQAPINTIDPAEHEKLKKDLSDSEIYIEKLRARAIEQDDLISKLKSAKDAEEVKAIELSSMSEMDAFKKLAAKLKNVIKNLPAAAAEALYYYARSESLPPPANGYSDTEDKWIAIRDAQKKNMLSDEDLILNESHPKIKKAIDALNHLLKFMDEKEEVLSPIIEDEYEVTYSLSDEDFWDQFLA